MAVNWNDLSKREAEEVLATDFSKGLSQKAAKERYKQSKYKLSLQKKKMQNTDNTLDWFSFAVLLLISVVSYFVMSAWKAAFFSLICVSAVLCNCAHFDRLFLCKNGLPQMIFLICDSP